MDATTEPRWCGVSTEHEPHARGGARGCPGYGHMGELGRELETLRKGVDRLREDLDRAKQGAGERGRDFAFGYLSEAVHSFLRTVEPREAEAA